VKNQILNVKSYQQVVQFAAELVAHDARKQWYSLPRTTWYSLSRNEWYSLTRILQNEDHLLSKERIEEYLGVALTDEQYPVVAKAIFELASLLIESKSER